MMLAELERAEQCMQQQWYDLVVAEQHGDSLEVLERMYDAYILLAEEYNRCYDAYQQEHQVNWESPSATLRKSSRLNALPGDGEEPVRLAS